MCRQSRGSGGRQVGYRRGRAQWLLADPVAAVGPLVLRALTSGQRVQVRGCPEAVARVHFPSGTPGAIQSG